MNDKEFVNETKKHILTVGKYINICSKLLFERAITHDQTKMENPEWDIFKEYTPKLATSTYGSDEYKIFLKEMNIALKHHYENNRHHPEYYENGIKDMTLIDLVEMLCDWKSATLRHNNGDIIKSIEQNQKRFGYSDELKQILLNTIKLIEKEIV